MVDRTTPFTAKRWIFTAILGALFITRIIVAQGWFLVTYALAIYLLNMFLAFLTPKVDPEFEQMSNDEELNDRGPELPTSANQEFTPFIRRLPEFKFWYASTRGIVFALVASLFEFTDVPVFWPILLIVRLISGVSYRLTIPSTLLCSSS
jgi:hypothetical protein